MSSPIPTLRVALVGCGQIADAHLSQIRRIPFAEPVAVCDVYEDLAYQAAVRFGVPGQYTDIERMVAETRPDVVHLTTPAQSHASLTRRLLNLGCHVYVEKPFTLNADEAAELLACAAAANRLVCVGHDQLFDPAWLTAKDWIARGRIGEVRHIESLLGYPIDGKFGSLVAGDPSHWVRRLPGGLFQNTISHPLYRITDLLTDAGLEVAARWSTCESFDFPTELQVHLQGRHRTGSLTFSTYIPPQRITRIHGTQGSLEVDLDTQVLRLSRRPRLPGALGKLEAPSQQFGNSLWNLGRNVWRFARAEHHYFAGMKTLFERFYRAIQGTGAVPIEPEEIHRVTWIMDQIFEQCRDRNAVSTAADTIPRGGVTCL